jgi:hypothetical protein
MKTDVLGQKLKKEMLPEIHLITHSFLSFMSNYMQAQTAVGVAAECQVPYSQGSLGYAVLNVY